MGELKNRKTMGQSEEIATKMKRKRRIQKESNTNTSGYLKMAAVSVAVVALLGLFWRSFAPAKTTIARVTEDVEYFDEVKCSDEHAKKQFVNQCTPTKCGRFVLDGLLNQREIDVLRELAEKGTMIQGGGSGGASILELSSSTVSSGGNFVSLFQLLKMATDKDDQATINSIKDIYSDDYLTTYYSVKEKVKAAIAVAYGLDEDLLHLAKPTFFSRLTGEEAQTPHDEYWHSHVDSNQYPSFDYTALVYLNDHGTHFTGGRFIFEKSDIGGVGHDQFLEPKAGRIGTFTSGAENPHRVEQVTSGERFAFTLGFTCNTEFKIPDPQLPKNM